MSPPLLRILEYVFLAVLYLFFLRVLRAVWIELREPKVVMLEPTVRAGDAMTPVPPAPAAEEVTVVTAGPRTGTAELVVEIGPGGGPGRRFPVGTETSVGRSPGCGVALTDDTFVSQVHARVFGRDGLVWVEDLGSTNGTYVNDARIDAPVPLRPGDRLQVGQTVLGLST